MLDGKTALITGSTSGIGLAMARALAAKGANIMLNGFGDPAEIDALKAEISGSHGVQVAYHGADMAKSDEIQSLMDETMEALGPIDILCNNAGIQRVHSIPDFPVDDWNAIIQINLTAVFHCTRLTLRPMMDRGWGRIINTASVHGLIASPLKSAYVAAKHGVVGLTKTTALEGATHGVTCNAICPGWTLTPLIKSQIDTVAERDGVSFEDGAATLVGERQPTKTFVETDQIGDLVAFLCSPAARQITGAALPIDGGWTAL